MDFPSFLICSPRTLSISTTYKCTASCNNCCIRCTPNVKQLLDFDSIKSIIDEVLHTFDSVEVVIFTGGESFLLGDSLVKAVKYVKEQRLLSRVVTNAYWAVSYDKAISTLRPLVEAGLTEINYSTGDDHQAFVPIQNIVNATLAANDLNLKTIVINTQVSQLIQAASPARSSRSKACFTALIWLLLFITFSMSSNGSHAMNPAMTLITSTISSHILWATESSTVSPVTSAKSPPMVSYASNRFTHPRILYCIMHSDIAAICPAKSMHWHFPRLSNPFISL